MVPTRASAISHPRRAKLARVLLTFLWAAVVVAGIGAVAAIVFYGLAGRAVEPDLHEWSEPERQDVIRQVRTLARRQLWRFDLGLVVGTTTALVGLAADQPPGPVMTAVGAFLALASLTGRLLVMGGRRRLLAMERAES